MARQQVLPETLASRRSGRLFGIALVMISTVAVAIVPTLAKLAYEGGSDTLTVITARSALSAAISAVFVLALGRTLRMSRRDLVANLALGPLYAAMLFSFLAAVLYLPVKIVVLIYFLHPLMIWLTALAMGHESLSWVRFAALIGAVVGLVLAIGFSLEGLSATGLLLAVSAAVTCAGLCIASAATMTGRDALLVTTYMMLSTAIILVVVTGISGDIQLPATSLGWFGFVGVAVAYTVGTLTFFGAMPLLGAVRATMISNLEPLLGILFAVLILGERLTLVQGVGSFLVVGSIVLMEAASGDSPGA